MRLESGIAATKVIMHNKVMAKLAYNLAERTGSVKPFQGMRIGSPALTAPASYVRLEFGRKLQLKTDVTRPLSSARASSFHQSRACVDKLLEALC